MTAKYMYTFTWPHPGPSTVLVTGSFNEWGENLELDKQDDGSFAKTLSVPNDDIQYKFIVDGEWQVDDKASTTSDEDGNVNNLVKAKNLSSVEEAEEPEIHHAAGTAAVASAAPGSSLPTTESADHHAPGVPAESTAPEGAEQLQHDLEKTKIDTNAPIAAVALENGDDPNVSPEHVKNDHISKNVPASEGDNHPSVEPSQADGFANENLAAASDEAIEAAKTTQETNVQVPSQQGFVPVQEPMGAQNDLGAASDEAPQAAQATKDVNAGASSQQEGKTGSNVQSENLAAASNEATQAAETTKSTNAHVPAQEGFVPVTQYRGTENTNADADNLAAESNEPAQAAETTKEVNAKVPAQQDFVPVNESKGTGSTNNANTEAKETTPQTDNKKQSKDNNETTGATTQPKHNTNTKSSSMEKSSVSSSSTKDKAKKKHGLFSKIKHAFKS